MPAKPRTPPTCPVCGEIVPRNALACPECGADHRSGWREDSEDDAFSYNEFIEEEFGAPKKPAGLHPLWWVTAVVLLLAFVWFSLRAIFPLVSR